MAEFVEASASVERAGKCLVRNDYYYYCLLLWILVYLHLALIYRIVSRQALPLSINNESQYCLRVGNFLLQSFVDGVDGVYSEYDGQSEYDPVVPGGTMTDGMLSEAGSSARYVFVNACVRAS